MKLYREFRTQEEIDEQYDLESVLDMPSYAARDIMTSQRACETLSCHLDTRYGPTMDEVVDVFPSGKPGSPVLVFIHGGWWRLLSNREHRFVALGLVPHDFTVVVLNYSLCPKVDIPEITRQSRAALAWVYQNIERFNGDREKIYVAGHSAGGHQVGMMALTDWPGEYGLPANLVKGGIPISGLFDLRPFYYSWLQPKLQLTEKVIERQSPLFHVAQLTHLMPMLITLGGDESPEFHRQSRTFGDAWRDQGGTVTSLDQPGKNHITAIAGFEDPDSPLCRAVVGFVRKHASALP